MSTAIVDWEGNVKYVAETRKLALGKVRAFFNCRLIPWSRLARDQQTQAIENCCTIETVVCSLCGKSERLPRQDLDAGPFFHDACFEKASPEEIRKHW